jgi:hypothetical protein
MFQPYMVIIRVANKKENKHTVAFGIDISVLYISICIRYMYIYISIWIVLGKKMVKVTIICF